MRDTVAVSEPVSTVDRGPWRALSSTGSKVALKTCRFSSRAIRSVVNGSWSRPDNRFDGVEGPFSHPQQTSEQLSPDLGECLHSGDANGAWNDRLGRRADPRATCAPRPRLPIVAVPTGRNEQPRGSHPRLRRLASVSREEAPRKLRCGHRRSRCRWRLSKWHGKGNTAADRHLRCNQAWQKRGPQTRLAVQFPYWIANIRPD